MTVDNIIAIASFVLTVVIFAWGLYQRVKGKATASVSALIAMAEETGLPGKEKMAQVVAQLHDLIPAPYKQFVTPEALEKLAQWIFDYMKKYALAYIDTHDNQNTNAYHEVNDSLATDLVQQLSSLGTVGLRELALKLGIEVSNKDDNEVMKEIVLMLLERREEMEE